MKPLLAPLQLSMFGYQHCEPDGSYARGPRHRAVGIMLLGHNKIGIVAACGERLSAHVAVPSREAADALDQDEICDPCSKPGGEA